MDRVERRRNGVKNDANTVLTYESLKNNISEEKRRRKEKVS